MPYKLNTKTAQSSASENTAPQRTISGLLVLTPVFSPTCITLENNGKIRPEPDREKLFSRASGGGASLELTSLCKFPCKQGN